MEGECPYFTSGYGPEVAVVLNATGRIATQEITLAHAQYSLHTSQLDEKCSKTLPFSLGGGSGSQLVNGPCSVGENVCNDSKNLLKIIFAFKNVLKSTYSFRGHLITPVFNIQLPKVRTGKSPTSNILLRNADVVFTFTRNYATQNCV